MRRRQRELDDARAAVEAESRKRELQLKALRKQAARQKETGKKQLEVLRKSGSANGDLQVSPMFAPRSHILTICIYDGNIHYINELTIIHTISTDELYTTQD